MLYEYKKKKLTQRIKIKSHQRKKICLCQHAIYLVNSDVKYKKAFRRCILFSYAFNYRINLVQIMFALIKLLKVLSKINLNKFLR